MTFGPVLVPRTETGRRLPSPDGPRSRERTGGITTKGVPRIRYVLGCCDYAPTMAAALAASEPAADDEGLLLTYLIV